MLQPQDQSQQAPEAPTNQELARVKVYKLSPEGQWQDKGTGHISIEYLEQSDVLGLVVVSEDENGEALLLHRVSEKDIYQRQGESSIITWNDAEFGADVAISFQEVTACDTIWSSIKQVQQEFSSEGHFAGRELAEGEGATDLPAPEIANLPEIVKIMTQATPFQRDRIAHGLLKPGYVAALMDTFKQCEDLEDSSSLGNLFRLMKAVIMLNDANVLEHILKDEFVMDVVGALEYDPDLSEQQHYRKFLSTCVVFKEVVPITDSTVLAKIHQTYRIQYIKDVILPRVLDDATYATLTSLALYNNVEVVSALHTDTHFLPELFQRLEKYSPDDSEWEDLVAFLQEFCTLCRHLQQSARQQLFNKLVQLNLFDVITRIMEGGNEAVKLKATDILSSIMTHDSNSLRHFLVNQADNQLLGLLVLELTEGSEGGLPEQVLELLKMLLDPETMDSSIEKNALCEAFYDRYINRFLTVIMSDKSLNPKDGTRVVTANTLGTILELMCFCVQHHAYRIKYFTLRSHMVEKVLKVLRRRERWLVCSGLRFLRICVMTKDEFFIRHLIRNNVFEPVMAVYFENEGRYNIIDSCILDTMDFILKENIRPLVDHLVEQYGHKFVDIGHVETFKKLQTRYDQAQEGRQEADAPRPGPVGARSEDESHWGQQGSTTGPSGRDGADSSRGGPGGELRNRTFVFPASEDPEGGPSTSGWGSKGGGLTPQRRRRDARGLDKDEEDYFSEDCVDDGDDGDANNNESLDRNEPASAGAHHKPAMTDMPHKSSDHGSRRVRAYGAQQGSGIGSEGPPAEHVQEPLPGPPAAAGPPAVESPPAEERTGASEEPPEVWMGLTEYGDDDEEGDASDGAMQSPAQGSRSQGSEKRKRPKDADHGAEEGAPPSG